MKRAVDSVRDEVIIIDDAPQGAVTNLSVPNNTKVIESTPFQTFQAPLKDPIRLPYLSENNKPSNIHNKNPLNNNSATVTSMPVKLSELFEIPQFFIVETQFIEKDRISLVNSTKSAPSKNEITSALASYLIQNTMQEVPTNVNAKTMFQKSTTTNLSNTMSVKQSNLFSLPHINLCDDELTELPKAPSTTKTVVNPTQCFNTVASKSAFITHPNDLFAIQHVQSLANATVDNSLHQNKTTHLPLSSQIRDSAQLLKSRPQLLVQIKKVDNQQQQKANEETRKCRTIGIQYTVPVSHKEISTQPTPTRSHSVQTKVSTLDKIMQCEILKPETNLYSEDVEYLYLIDDNSPQLTQNEENVITMMKVHSNGKCECNSCGEITNSISVMKIHLEMHENKSVLCDRCGRLFENDDRLEKHKIVSKCTSKTNNKNDEILVKDKRKRKLFCPYPMCGQLNYTLLEMYDHINCHSGEKLHVCSCKRSFTSYEKYSIHLKLKKCSRNSYKFPYATMRRKDKQFKKSIYKVYTMQNNKLFIKKKCNMGNTKNLCKYCYKNCRNSFELLQHVRKLHLKVLRCFLCNQLILSSKNYDHHMRGHRYQVVILN